MKKSDFLFTMTFLPILVKLKKHNYLVEEVEAVVADAVDPEC
jgi:hypothetical protein